MSATVQIELKLVDDQAALLRWHVLTYFQTYAPTKARSKTLQHCLLWLNYRHGFRLRDHRSIRDAVKELRRAGELICSQGGFGHWMAENLEQVKEYTSKELRGKALDLMVTARRQRLAAIDRFGGQMRMREKG